MSNDDSNLVRFDRGGLELVIDQATGECFASMSAAARMCGCEVTQIRRLIGDTKSLKAAIVKTLNGDREAQLLSEDQLRECLAKYNPSLLVQCSGAGLRVYLHKLAGFEIQSKTLTGESSTLGFLGGSVKDEIDLACFALDAIYGGVVEPSRLAIAKHKAVVRINPVLAAYIGDTESMLPSAPPEDQTFTPTQIGKMLEPSISPQKVNKLLEEHGFQENQPTAKGKVHWVPTASGKPHCVVTLDSKANGDPVESVRWKKSIVDELLEAIA